MKTVTRLKLMPCSSIVRRETIEIDDRPILERIVEWFQNIDEKTANLSSKLDTAMEPIHSSLKEERRRKFEAAVKEAMK